MVAKLGQRSRVSFEVKKQVAADQPRPKRAAERFGNEFSSGRGSALRAKALNVTGATAFVSTRALTESEGAGSAWPTGPLSPGDENSPQVGVMQDRLIERGYLDANDVAGYRGRYGSNTEAAVELFQRANGLPPTGVADARTLQRMASTSATWSDVKASRDARVIGTPIGQAGQAPVPTMQTLEPQMHVGTTDAWVRDAPDAELIRQDTLIPAGTTVTVTMPQPEGGAEGWRHVSAEVDGKTITGWVMDGAGGIDRLVGVVDSRLEELGYLAPGTTTNEDAVRNYQLMNGLPATGQLDDETLASMWSSDAMTSTHLRQVVNAQWNHNSPNATSNDCGPTATAMALAAVGLKPIDNDDPAAAIAAMREVMGGSSSDKTGTGDIEAGIAAGGGSSYRVDTSDEVMLAVTDGDPVVLYGWNAEYQTYHWVTVQGFDPSTQTWLVSDPLSTTGVAQWSQAEFDTYFSDRTPSVAVENPR
ncbi:MAG: hypothetical protein DI536_33625 [Archangium gephyra]|uniref:Peptidoglycan binding-like domain-containing protein n=1 Tax=Archangium gephyra TaxID=48 RepID=A0A2W5UNA6_9BACT|nr:MAG: hypothetical protein DI536_33625 [Archangium gephyra]